MRPLVVRADAEADIEEAFRWYEARSPGLGTEFVRAVDVVLAAIERQPDVYPTACRHARRAVLRRVPYAVYYAVPAGSIDVLACMPMRRPPRRWRRRV